MLWVMLWMLTIVGAAWVALGWLPAGRDGHMPLPYLIALTPFAWIPMAVIAIAAGVMGDWWLAAAAIAVAAVSQLRHARYRAGLFRSATPSSRPSPSHRRPNPQQPSTQAHPQRDLAMLMPDRMSDEEVAAWRRSSSSASFNVMTLNCRYGRADARAIVSAVLTRNITVLALQELTDGLVHELDELGLDVLLPYRQLGQRRSTDNGGINGVWIRVEPKSTRQSAVDIPAADVPSMTIPIDSMRDITFASAHTKSPMRGCAAWSAGVIGLGRLAADPDGVAVVLGDLNAGIDHPSFRALLDAGFADANLSVARGPRATFPRWLRWPRIVLDHVLATRGADFTAVDVQRIDGTDHLALIAAVTLG